MKPILTLDDSRIQKYLSLKDKNNKKSNQIILETEKVILEALRSNINITEIFAREDFFSKNVIPPHINCLYANQSLLNKIVGYRLHQGIMAIAERPLEYHYQKMKGPILYLNGLTSPENVGTICRNLKSFNFSNIIVDQKTVHPFTRRCIRVSIGHSLNLKTYQTLNSISVFNHFLESGYQLVAANNSSHAIEIHLAQKKISNNFILILGSEGAGVDSSLLNLCNHQVKIPINSQVDSLNVASASAILLYQLSLNSFK